VLDENDAAELARRAATFEGANRHGQLCELFQGYSVEQKKVIVQNHLLKLEDHHILALLDDLAGEYHRRAEIDEISAARLSTLVASIVDFLKQRHRNSEELLENLMRKIDAIFHLYEQDDVEVDPIH
jgi:hypothetical protein